MRLPNDGSEARPPRSWGRCFGLAATPRGDAGKQLASESPRLAFRSMLLPLLLLPLPQHHQLFGRLQFDVRVVLFCVRGSTAGEPRQHPRPNAAVPPAVLGAGKVEAQACNSPRAPLLEAGPSTGESSREGALAYSSTLTARPPTLDPTARPAGVPTLRHGRGLEETRSNIPCREIHAVSLGQWRVKKSI